MLSDLEIVPIASFASGVAHSGARVNQVPTRAPERIRGPEFARAPELACSWQTRDPESIRGGESFREPELGKSWGLIHSWARIWAPQFGLNVLGRLNLHVIGA